MCSKKARGGSFNTARKELIEGGHVKEEGGLVVPTEVEERKAPTTEDLIEMWPDRDVEGCSAGPHR